MTIEEALSSEQGKQWKAAADSEYKRLGNLLTYLKDERPSGFLRSSIQVMGKRLVARATVRSMDYNETFSPVVQFSSIPTLLAFVVLTKPLSKGSFEKF